VFDLWRGIFGLDPIESLQETLANRRLGKPTDASKAKLMIETSINRQNHRYSSQFPLIGLPSGTLESSDG
jgi:hypothetical protein